ncbi:hypothetical protein PLICRDRAFT_701174 [Plicaturopsis crispa FD-325 SS-3]|nr:hypothetical protein PLICRDRAFT_701174 [Plicaturopsis crispa FD-325 SS-3]
MFSRLPLAVSVFLLSCRGYVLPGQQILDASAGDRTSGAGLLRRFVVNGSHDLEGFIRVAQNEDMDLWQATPSHVDVFSPTFGLIPESLSNYSYSETFVPALPLRDPQILSGDWNLSSFTNSTYHTVYHPLYEVDNFMHEIAKLHPASAQVVSLGHSGLQREMYGLTISQPAKDTVQKFGFVIMGAQHAREWVATATSLYLAHALVANASETHSLSHLLEDFDFYIIPSPNPDGYEYTWESDRYWYKNRMVLGPDAKCVGLDMNRNWGYKWKPTATNFAKGPPTDPCSHWYPGGRAFEAPEVNNIANYISTLPNIEVFIDLRSYGQMLSAPYSFSCKKIPGDAEDQLEAAHGATRALKTVHGTSFMTGSLCSMLYRAPGNVIDWMYKRAGIKYSYVAHLRDTGTYGFSLPSRLIRPVGEETGKMVEYLSKFIVAKRSITTMRYLAILG